MQVDFDEWYNGFLRSISWSLAPFSPRIDDTGDKELWKRYYIDDRNKKERFVMHIRPVPTKRRVNICIGKPGTELIIPEGFPMLELRDHSHPTYREFDASIDEPRHWIFALDLAVQVALKWRS